MAAKTFTVGNFKGGVGKTKIATMLAYDNAEIRNEKTLLVDLDPQANASDVLAKSFGLSSLDKTIMDGINANDFNEAITHLSDNLDLIACTTSFSTFEKFVIQGFSEETDQVTVLRTLLDPIKDKYQAIFLDVPPTISVFSDNAMAASDYSIIAFQTVDESLQGVKKYVSYQNFMAEHYGVSLQVIDIIPCMLTSDDKLDHDVLAEAREEFGDTVSSTVIKYQKRLKGYSRTGITLNRNRNGNYEQWDYRAHAGFIDLLNELDARDEFVQSNKEA